MGRFRLGVSIVSGLLGIASFAVSEANAISVCAEEGASTCRRLGRAFYVLRSPLTR